MSYEQLKLEINKDVIYFYHEVLEDRALYYIEMTLISSFFIIFMLFMVIKISY